MEEYDILGGQNILWSILHIFRGSGPHQPHDLQSRFWSSGCEHWWFLRV